MYYDFHFIRLVPPKQNNLGHFISAKLYSSQKKKNLDILNDLKNKEGGDVTYFVFIFTG